jgi:hypothetical protein
MPASSEPVRGREYGCFICLAGVGVLHFLLLFRTTSGSDLLGVSGWLPFSVLCVLLSVLMNLSLDLNECDLVIRADLGLAALSWTGEI